jgi:hypothetical protein
MSKQKRKNKEMKEKGEPLVNGKRNKETTVKGHSRTKRKK